MAGLTERGYKLKVKLLQEGKSQMWLAKQLNVSKQLLSNVLYGAKNLLLELAIDKYIEEGVIDDQYKNRQRQR